MDETVAKFIEMGFSMEMIGRAIEETGGENPEPMMILETLFKLSTSSEASSSKSKVIDELIGMGFSEELVIKAIQEHGEKNLEEITNALLSYAEAEKMHETENEDINNNYLSDDNDDTNLYSGLSSSDEENELNSFHGDGRLQDLIKMGYPRKEASIALERCGEIASLAEVVDFIFAAQMARQLDEFWAAPDEQEVLRINEPPPRRRRLNTDIASDDELIRLPNPMIGFGVPKEPGIITERPVPIPSIARGPPYFYYENVAMTPKGVWAKMSSHLYDIKPEFVDSLYFCAAARKRGYIHNLPIKNRFEIQPTPHYTIQEEFPLTKKWWPAWDKRTKLNCVLTCIASAQLTNKIRKRLEKHERDPAVQKDVVDQCKKWNLVWVGKNKAAPLEPYEMERLLGFPNNHTRGISRKDRYKSLGNSFQVDTVAYHLSVLKPLYPKGINVLSLFTGIGGGEVALHRLQIPMKLVVSVEISEVNRNIFRSFWEQTNQRGDLIEFRDVEELDDHKIEGLMDQYGGFDLVIGGSPCNNLAGANRVSRTGLEGDQSSLFYDYCRILEAVRSKASRMRRRDRYKSLGNSFQVKLKETMFLLRPRRLILLEFTPPLPLPSTDTTQLLHNAFCSKIENFKNKVFDELTTKDEKVLEIGIGTGPNMRYFAARNVNVTLLGLDPNPKMKKYARKAAVRAGLNPKNFRFMQGVGEAIPLEDGSVDAVVATLVLCTVSDVTQTLNEIKRVLRPGGRFIFLEHVAAEDGSLFRRLQKLLDPLQQILADGCHLTRNTRECILEAGFSGGAQIETVSMYSFPWVTRPHIYGVAYK
uniref:DNA (cytosine-5-)-methyltransferase n=1 Tax=Brassica campestris TaxID=3711 RepID=M4CJK4_BRACM